ncbi:secreted RxLR effector protein 161-like [Lucilia cuprina]|uniref:secreted RxLR effector protein 161-like n=1 Tax=Lucilia cuprina TaxID=7375 RepID=UPI001F05B656|nr:secreted RxLR effector protein 161-like [Lucilia cuprina]
MLSQFCQDPHKQHWTAAIYIVRYLNTTKKFKIVYRKDSLPLVGYVDANWATDINDRKSQTDFCFSLAGGAISWESRKQRVVATSSAESEYIALAEASKEAYYLRYLLSELEYLNDNATIVYIDSQSAQQMAKFGGHHSRTKHIDYKYHFIRQAVEDKIIDVQYKPTSEMVAHVLTKPLPNIKHNFCISSMGIQVTI